MSTKDYAGDVTPAEAWEWLKTNPKTKLVDVRTQAEWVYVGVPDLTAADKKPILVSWQIFPAMVANPAFVQQVQAQGIQPGDQIVLLCRSGVRSLAAAKALAAAGFTDSWNISDGFEGTLDGDRHRGTVSGWKQSGLPWAQG